MPDIITPIITPLTIIAALVTPPPAIPSPDASTTEVAMTAAEQAQEMRRPPTAAELGPALLPPLDGSVYLYALPAVPAEGEATERAINDALCDADEGLGLTHGTPACRRR